MTVQRRHANASLDGCIQNEGSNFFAVSVMAALLLLSPSAFAQQADSDPRLGPEHIALSDEYSTESPEACLFPPAHFMPPDSSQTSTIRTASTGGEPYRIVVRFNIVRRSDGTGGFDESLLPYFMKDVNYGFRDTPFYFVQTPEIIYIDNDAHYANIPNWPTAIALLLAHNEPGIFDNIITPTLFGGPPVTGLNFVSNPRGNIMAYERIGHPHSIVYPPHEFGHVLGLYHPYEGQFGQECTSGSNCNFAGDLLCDTPASPIVHGGNTTATGIFFAEIPGPCVNDPLFAPLTDLYMEAGWPAGHILRDRFTAGELDRMVNTLLSVSPDLIGPLRPEIVIDCDHNGLDDAEEILAGNKQDLNFDMVPDVCEIFPNPGDLLVSGMTIDVLNRVRFFDGETGDFRETIWNGMTWVHQLRMGPDGLVYLARLTVVQRMDLKTGRTVDNFIDGVLEGASVFVDLLFEADGHILVLDNVSKNIRRYAGETGEFVGVFANLLPVGMTSPKYMEYGPDGDIFVVGNGGAGNTIQRVDGGTGMLEGSFIVPGAGGLSSGQGLLFHTDGRLYVSNGGANNVLIYDAEDGQFVGEFVSSGSGGLSNPHSLRFGPDGHLYVASRNTDSVKRYDGETGLPLGDFVTAGADGLDQPAGLLFVPKLGDLDGDGDVDAFDLALLLGSWGPCGDCNDCPADLDGNCTVGAADLAQLLGNWG